MQASKIVSGFVAALALALAISTAPVKAVTADEVKAIIAFGTVLSIVYIRDCNGKTTDQAAKAAWSNYTDQVLKPYIAIIEPAFTENRAKLR